MLRVIITLSILQGLSNCGSDETLTGYGAVGVAWQLTEIDGVLFPAQATLQFPREGQIEGEAPCNQFTGTQSAPYPWFAAEDISVTRRACPDLDAEYAFFDALGEMSLAEVTGDTLILSNDAGREMVFRSAP